MRIFYNRGNNMKRFLFATLLASTLMAGSASAATILNLTTGTADTLDASYDPNNAATGAAIGDAVLVADSLGEGLKLDGAATLIFTFLGKEASFNNLFNLVAGNQNLFSNFSAIGATSGPIAMTPDANGFLGFKFVSNGTTDVTNGLVTGAGALSTIAFKLLSASTNTAVFLALFNDAGGPDADYDDMVIRIEAIRAGEATPVPVPAGLLLLLSGLTGLGFLSRSGTKVA
jgi:hypothetical protein